MISFSLQSFAQEVIFKAKILKEELPIVIIDEVIEDFPDYELDEFYTIPVNFIEEDIIIETDKLVKVTMAVTK
ncbi:hypothetical protein [Aureibaculum conchae]|uniref:hypothetical protein n=1 Tax=Aureibaculum sp. 2308TA14-22 TaxID=3108392 RepID=UPI00339A005E